MGWDRPRTRQDTQGDFPWSTVDVHDSIPLILDIEAEFPGGLQESPDELGADSHALPLADVDVDAVGAVFFIQCAEARLSYRFAIGKLSLSVCFSHGARWSV